MVSKILLVSGICLVAEGLKLAGNAIARESPELEKLDDFMIESLNAFVAFDAAGSVDGKKPSSPGFRTTCLHTTKSLAFANAGSKKRVDHSMAVACSRYNHPLRTKACNMLRETLQGHLSDDADYNLQSLDYNLLCDGFYLVLGAPSAGDVNVTGLDKAPVLKCAKNVKAMLTDFPGPTLNLGAALMASCSRPEVQKNVGGDQVKCEHLMKALGKAHAGDQDYFPWCRSLKMQNPGYLSSIVDDLMGKLKENPKLEKSVNTCKAHCPQIAKIIRNVAVMSSIRADVQKRMTSLMKEMMAPPTGKPSDASSEAMQARAKKGKELQEYMQKKQVEAGNVQIQMCDFERHAKCNPGNMHQSCSDTMDAIAPGIDMMFEMVWQTCKKREPCAKACHGVDTKGTAYFFAKTTFEMKRASETNFHEGAKDMCAKYEDVKECYAKDECTDYLDQTPISMFLTESKPGPDEPPSQTEECNHFGNPCFEKQLKHCNAEWKAAYDPIPEWDDNTCPHALMLDLKKEAMPVRAKCCVKHRALSQCMKKHKCSKFNDQTLSFAVRREFYEWDASSFEASCAKAEEAEKSKKAEKPKKAEKGKKPMEA